MALLSAEELAAKNDARIQALQKEGYVWDQDLSISYAGVVLRKGDDLYVFDMEGNEHHNPEGISIKTTERELIKKVASIANDTEVTDENVEQFMWTGKKPYRAEIRTNSSPE